VGTRPDNLEEEVRTEAVWPYVKKYLGAEVVWSYVKQYLGAEKVRRYVK
jgi:hypothetical protein